MLKSLLLLQVTGLNVRANLVAAHTAGGRGADVKAIAAALKITPEDGFEVAFNLACSMLHCNQLAEAKDCLLFALRLGDIYYSCTQPSVALAPPVIDIRQHLGIRPN